MTSDEDPKARFGVMSAKVPVEELSVLDRLVELERAKGGELAGLTKAAFLRNLVLDAGERAGLRPAQFRDPAVKAVVPRPQAHEGAYDGPSAEAVLGALELAFGAGVAMTKIAQAAGIPRSTLSVFWTAHTMRAPHRNLPKLAEGLAKLGYPTA